MSLETYDTYCRLKMLHRDIIFPEVYKTITWEHVAEVEFEIKKKDSTLYLTSSTFWITHDRDEKGCFRILFTDDDFPLPTQLPQNTVTIIEGMAKELGSLVDTNIELIKNTESGTFHFGFTCDQNLKKIAMNNRDFFLAMPVDKSGDVQAYS